MVSLIVCSIEVPHRRKSPFHFASRLVSTLNYQLVFLRPLPSGAMNVFRLILLAASTSAFAIAPLPSQTPPPNLAIRQETAPTAAPTPSDIMFLTTKLETIPGKTEAHVTIPDKTLSIIFPTCIQTEIPDKNGYVPPGTCNSLFAYYPSFVAALITTGFFGVLVGAHVFLAWKWKAVSRTRCRLEKSELTTRDRITVGLLSWAPSGKP